MFVILLEKCFDMRAVTPMARFSLRQFNEQCYTKLLDELKVSLTWLMVLDSADEEHSGTGIVVLDCLV